MEYIAKKFIGSREMDGELADVISPYSKDVVTKYVKCSANDAK